MKYSLSHSSIPHSLSKSLPGLANMTCLVFSLMARATLIGFLDVVRPHAEPTSPSTPVIRQESMDTMPSLVNAAPRPALNSGASSITRIAAHTASSAGAPCSSSASQLQEPCSNPAPPGHDVPAYPFCHDCRHRVNHQQNPIRISLGDVDRRLRQCSFVH